MHMLTRLYDTYCTLIDRLLGQWFLPTLARFSFAAVLLMYFWISAKTKLGEGISGIIQPSDNAYIQIFPKAMEAAGYDSSQLNVFHWFVALAGTWAEFIIPALIILGLLTRLAALGMIGFVLVQSFVDVKGHGISGKTLGAWFDSPSDSLLMDQRLMWITVLMILVIKGAGPLSLDRLLLKR